MLSQGHLTLIPGVKERPTVAPVRISGGSKVRCTEEEGVPVPVQPRKSTKLVTTEEDPGRPLSRDGIS